MRPIIFRAKRVDNGEWVEGYLVVADNLIATENKLYIIESGAKYYLFGEFDPVTEVIPETVGQFTGLLDKHGKKIFEGDVLKNSYCVTLRSGDNENKWDCTIMGVVTFRKGGFWVKSSEFDFPINEYEVIGNVIDNPELLEVKND